jgi:peptidoglycan/xylan/chitin deacetylase (PgdA/CDA1 family)
MNTTRLARQGVKIAALPFGAISRRHARDLVILLYHRVGGHSGEIDMPLDAFERQLSYLREHEPVCSLDDALAGAGGVVLTFDDGSRDFHEHVVPLLDRLRIPAVLYLATEPVTESPHEDPDAITWSQLAAAVSTGLVTIASPTPPRRSPARASRSDAHEEMVWSKELIEDRLGVPCEHFAYPYAVGSAGADRAARDLFSSAALDGWRTNRAGQIDPFRLGRTPILRSDGQVFFRAKVRGGLNGEAWAYRALGRGPWSHL